MESNMEISRMCKYGIIHGVRSEKKIEKLNV